MGRPVNDALDSLSDDQREALAAAAEALAAAHRALRHAGS